MNTRKPYEIKVVGNYEFDEVASALQKTVRRNMEYDACFWAFILHESGYYKYAWKRLLIIASEDVGNATPDAALLVHTLQQNYHYSIASVNRSKNDALVFLFQAVIFLCRAEKTRETDSLVNLIRTRYQQGERLKIPPFARDMHTKSGRVIHGSWEDGSQEEIDERHRKWFDTFSQVKPDVGDRYVDDLRKLKGVE